MGSAAHPEQHIRGRKQTPRSSKQSAAAGRQSLVTDSVGSERGSFMSKTELAQMNLRELRQLASKHHVNNRSRLAKQELIDALNKVIAVKGGAEDTGGSDKAKSRPAAGKARAGSSSKSEKEPEVLDAKAVAALTTESSRDSSGESGESSDADDSSNERESGRGRRRGGRRRGRRRSDSDKAQDDTTTEAAEQKKPQQEEREERKGQRSNDDSSSADQKDQANRAPKPRLDNKKLRSLPPILKRLKSLTGGLLELCDPDTPSWAQARMSELLAETGVLPTPCQGQPHPDFHEVVGTVKTDQVPAGQIAVIEAPGFSLRGDRGDLFALRKAKVRVAGKEDSDSSAGNSSSNSAAAEKSEDKAAAPAQPEKKSADAEAGASASAAGASQAGTQAKPRESADAADKESESSQPDESRTEKVKVSKENARKRKEQRVTRAECAAPLPLEPQAAAELDERGFAEEFGKLGLNRQIQADLHAMQFEHPSPIQEQCIPVALTGSDIIGQAQTGTGKTAAFVLPILHHLYNWEGAGPVALVCCPTRELARQVHREFVKMAGQSAARAALIYGGVSMDDQFDALASNPHVVIGTPGRLIDHLKRHTLDLSHLKMLVLDEADQMLDIGFLPDIEYIFNHSNPERQCLLFSATMSDEILRITQKYQKEPAHIHVRPENTTAENVDQKFIAVDRNKKNDLLAHFIETYNPEQLVVFCRTKAQTDRVAQVLRRKKKKAAAIHGDLPQGKRERTLQQFRDGSLHCLIATNVAARGLDIPAISHVVNYDIPENPDEYVHRIGRTGRMGADGVARTFITSDDGQFLVEIEKLIGFELEEEVIEGFTAKTVKEVNRSIADTPTNTPRLLKPLVGGIRLGRRRR